MTSTSSAEPIMYSALRRGRQTCRPGSLRSRRVVFSSGTCRPAWPVNASVTNKRLGKKSLQPSRSAHGLLIVGREFLHAQHGDDVLQLTVALDGFRDLQRELVMPLADVDGSSRRDVDASGSIGGIKPLGGQIARQHDARIEMR